MYASYYPQPAATGRGRRARRPDGEAGQPGDQAVRRPAARGWTWRSRLAGDPDLLFLDEPTTGFDPSARREAWEVVKNLASLGKTVLLTTHYMDEAQYLADRVAVIAAGRIVAEGTPATLGDRNLARARIRYRLPAGATPPDDGARRAGRGRLHGDHVR